MMITEEKIELGIYQFKTIILLCFLLHKDTANKNTVASFIIFLNDNFQGGHLIFDGGITIYPKKGRAVFFDGPNIEHEVNRNMDGDRYIVAGWFCK